MTFGIDPRRFPPERDGSLTLPAIQSLFPRDKREAMEALKELLRDKGVPSSANWESALKMIQKDARWVTFAKLILILILILILTGFTPSTGRSTRT